MTPSPVPVDDGNGEVPSGGTMAGWDSKTCRTTGLTAR